MKIRSAALIGVGAVGAYFVKGLMEKEDVDFSVIAEGERKERLIKDGVTINGVNYRPAVKEPEEAKGVDLILIAVKYNGLAEAADYAARMVKSDTIVMSLLNGVTSEQIVGDVIGSEHMLYSVMRIQSFREGNNIVFDPGITAGVFFGEEEVTEEKSERVLAVEELFYGTGIRCTFVPDMKGEMWNKFSSNVCRNIPQAMLGVGFGAYADSEHVGWMEKVLEDEVAAVAEANGVIIPPMDEAVKAKLMSVEKKARFSTLQDIDAKRHTEVEMLLGDLIRLAGNSGVPVPYSTFCYHFIKAMEEKSDGLFDY